MRVKLDQPRKQSDERVRKHHVHRFSIAVNRRRPTPRPAQPSAASTTNGIGDVSDVVDAADTSVLAATVRQSTVRRECQPRLLGMIGDRQDASCNLVRGIRPSPRGGPIRQLLEFGRPVE